jgi:hypothetical protein
MPLQITLVLKILFPQYSFTFVSIVYVISAVLLAGIIFGVIESLSPGVIG